MGHISILMKGFLYAAGSCMGVLFVLLLILVIIAIIDIVRSRP